MNNIPLRSRKNQGYFLVTLLALLFVSVLSSCRKDDDEVVSPDLSFITFVHSSPQYPATPLDFYIGGVKTTQALQFTESSTRYTGTPYFGLYSGAYYIQVGLGGTTQQVLGGNMEFKANETYSFFITTKSPTVDSAFAIVTTDNLSAPSAGKAKVRFVNLSRSATALDLALGGQPIFTNKAYNTYTDFMEVNPGQSLTFQARDAGTSNVRATSAALNIEGGKIYTIWASGATGAYGLQMIVNK
ncbi:DUF4397 domain-containing protein [Desertivirga brevis]|uniref:DUF4397 domain-containing protein n=1 Tax=Desertivirga brevis TaxID=2810310 RepID=UPI001A9657DC|nr:DUF4397 domain-containing protein [Pedobacter sp. SYSU D00873]